MYPTSLGMSFLSLSKSAQIHRERCENALLMSDSLSLSPLPLHVCPVPACHVFLSLVQSPSESGYVSAQSRTHFTMAFNRYHVGIVCCF